MDSFEIFTVNSVNLNEKERSETLIKILSEQNENKMSREFFKLCIEFSDIFTMESDRMTVNNFYKQKFRLIDPDPVYIKNYRLPKTEKKEIKKQVEKLIDNDLIEPSQSNFNSPLILVPKKSKDGQKKYRMCVDCRLVHRKLIADKFPLPRIDDILDNLGRARILSILDLYSGFHQIGIDSRDVTSFSRGEWGYNSIVRDKSI